MFSELFAFEKRRSQTQAVGFYLFYLFLLFAVLFVIALAGSILTFDPNFAINNPGLRLVQILTAMLASFVLSFLVLFKKNRLRSAGPVAIALLSGVGAYFLGGLLGLAITAYLTTLEPD